MKYISIITLFIMLSGAIQAQHILSMEEAVNKAAQNSNAIKVVNASVLESKAEYAQTNAIFLPSIEASYTGISTTNPLMAFGSKLNQEILTQNDFNPSLLNDPDQTTNFATKIEVMQPLLNFDGIFHRSAAKAKMEASEFQQARTQEYVVMETKKAYMQLQLAIGAVNVLMKTREALFETLRITKNSFNQGLIQKSDLLAVEVRYTEVENQLQLAQSNVLNASNYLSVLFNDETFTLYQPADSLSLMNVPLDIKVFTEERSDILALGKALEAYESAYKADKMAFLPRLNAFGSFELYDDKFFQADANGYIVGAQLSWNLFDGSKKIGKVAKSKASFEKSKYELDQYKMESRSEFNRTNRLVQDAYNSVRLAKLAVEQSEESLRIRNNRYKEGLERTSDLLIAETQFAQKQLELNKAIFQYNYAQLYLNFLSK